MKLGIPFLQLPLLFDAEAMAAEIHAIGETAWRPHPQGYAGNDALPLISRNGDPDNDAVAGPMRPTEHLARCPYLVQVLDSIGATWGRTRLMRLSGRAEVTAHVDKNYYWRERARVHVPIVTQPTVRFICGDAQVNMRAGECWIFDTWLKHNVVNDHSLPRIHLVADTVGGAGFWQHVANARLHDREFPGWQPRACPPVAGHTPVLECETENFPVVMTPWEIRVHYTFLLGEATPDASLARIQQALIAFSRRWHALWAHYGADPAGWPRYRAEIDTARRDLADCGADYVALRNGVVLMDALQAWIFDPALADRRSLGDPEVRTLPAGLGSGASARAARPAERDPVFDRPVFIVSPPRSGSTLLFETLAQSPSVCTIGDESHLLIEGIPALSPAARGFDSNRLSAGDATPEVADLLRERFLAALRDRSQRRPGPGDRVRMLEKTPKNALRLPFLTQVFPEARFIYLHRDPRQVLASMLEAWQSGRFRTYPNLPGWSGLPWSLLLVPGWRELIGRPLHHVVAEQWRMATQILLDDLEQLPADRWTSVQYDALVADPQAEIRRLCAANALDWDRSLDGSLPLSAYTVSAPDRDKWRRHAAEIEAVLPMIRDEAERAARLAGRDRNQTDRAIA